MNAIKGGVVAGGYGTNSDLIMKIEEAIKRRLDIGSRINFDKLVEDLEGRYSNPSAIYSAVKNLVQKEEFDSIQDGKVLLRKR